MKDSLKFLKTVEGLYNAVICFSFLENFTFMKKIGLLIPFSCYLLKHTFYGIIHFKIQVNLNCYTFHFSFILTHT